MKNKRNKEIIIWNNFQRNFARNCVKVGFYFQSNSVKNSLICPKAKSATHCLTKLFPIYQNKHWTIRRWDDHTLVPSCHLCTVLYWRLFDFWTLKPHNQKYFKMLSETWERGILSPVRSRGLFQDKCYEIVMSL